jgi:hypothetical protein
MTGSVKCPACGGVIRYDTPDEVVCGCGWSESGQVAKDARRRCESQGLNFRHLLRILGDVETVDAYVRALSKDD